MGETALHKESAHFHEFERHKERLQFTRENLIPKIALIDPDKAKRMQTCGNFVYVCQCESCRAKHYAGSHRCYSRFCLECAHHRSLAYVAKMMERIMPLVEAGYGIHMLTFTIRDQENLADQIERLKAAWRVINHDDKMLRKKFKSRLVGGFRAFEVKLGANSGLWHAHMHTIVLTPPGKFEKDYDWLQPAWKNATCGDGSIEIHKIQKRGGQAFGILKAVVEVSKYLTSPDKLTTSLEGDRFNEMYLHMKGFRSVNSWGLLRSVVKEAEEEDEKLPLTEKKLADFVCRLCGNDTAEFRVLFAEALKNAYLIDLK